MSSARRRYALGLILFAAPACRAATPVITSVTNAFGGSATIAPNTWVAIKGTDLAPANDSRIWQTSDFVKNQMPTQLDGVSVTLNGASAYVYFTSAAQINILTPPSLASGAVQVVVSSGGSSSAAFPAQAQPYSLSLFVFGGGPYALGTHLSGSDLGPAGLYPGLTTPAQAGESVVLYANGFGPTSQPVVAGSSVQGGTLATLPVVQIGGIQATVQFAGLVSPGLYQLNVMVPANAPSGDDPITVEYNGLSTQADTMLAVTNPAAQSTTFYVALDGSDSWSGALPVPNASSTDGPFATFDHARIAVQAFKNSNLVQVTVRFRAGTYYLASTQRFSAADSGNGKTKLVYKTIRENRR